MQIDITYYGMATNTYTRLGELAGNLQDTHTHSLVHLLHAHTYAMYKNSTPQMYAINKGTRIKHQ